MSFAKRWPQCVNGFVVFRMVVGRSVDEIIYHIESANGNFCLSIFIIMTSLERYGVRTN